jgi:hypothetical protein
MFSVCRVTSCRYCVSAWPAMRVCVCVRETDCMQRTGTAGHFIAITGLKGADILECSDDSVTSCRSLTMLACLCCVLGACSRWDACVFRTSEKGLDAIFIARKAVVLVCAWICHCPRVVVDSVPCGCRFPRVSFSCTHEVGSASAVSVFYSFPVQLLVLGGAVVPETT